MTAPENGFYWIREKVNGEIDVCSVRDGWVDFIGSLHTIAVNDSDFADDWEILSPVAPYEPPPQIIPNAPECHEPPVFGPGRWA